MIFDMAAKKVYISVSALCRTVVNHGSIDARGIRIFKDNGRVRDMLEGHYGISFTPDVSVERIYSRGGLLYSLSGICDGIIRRDNKVCVCVNRTVSGFTSLVTTDMAAEDIGNAVCFAYMLAEKETLLNVSFLVTYYHNQNDVKYIEKTYSKQDLCAAFNRIIDMHRPFVALEAERLSVRAPSAKGASFPYRDIRPQQRDFMVEVLRAVKTHGRAFIEAPTGTGKTMAALFPALKAFGSGYVDKIFYFTSKTTTAFAALEAAKKLGEDTGVRAVQIVAKERLCPVKIKDPFKCTPQKCPRANGHYKRSADAITDIVSEHRVIDMAAINEFANKHSVCPYELSLDLTEYCDVVICDYNYLIDEAAHFRRYFGEGEKNGQKYLFLFDEAHNLLERAKASFGAELRLGKIRKFFDEVRTFPKNAVCETLSSVDYYINSMRELCADSAFEGEDGMQRGFTTLHSFDKQFYDLLTAFTKAVDRYARSEACGALPDSIFEICDDAKKYISALELFDECFVHTISVYGTEVVTKIVCLDPAKRLAKCTDKGVASIFFSATLTPLNYYATLYGAPEAVKLKLDSPYDMSNLCVCIMDKLSVKYQYRSQNASALADALMSVVGRHDGNYMVYFPSYEYMTEVQTIFKYKYPHIKTVMQSKNMSEVAKREFLDAFKPGGRSTMLGFSVLGGIYSEGIDLVGDRLVGSIIVGVGLTRPTDESEVLREYCDNKYEAGTEYAYTYPAFNRVLQAAGRVIRSESDRGVVLFIDERYAEPTYKELMPYHFRKAKFVGDSRSLEMVVDSFWNQE